MQWTHGEILNLWPIAETRLKELEAEVRRTDEFTANGLNMALQLAGKMFQTMHIPEPSDVSPTERIQPLTNEFFNYDRPAILSAEEVTNLLKNFRGDCLRAMKILLIVHRNEPATEEWRPDPEEWPIGFTRDRINDVLKKITVRGGNLHLAGRCLQVGGGRIWQLWEITRRPRTS